MADKKWKLISSTPVFKSKWIGLLDNNYLLPSGERLDHYYQIVRASSVQILVLNPRKEILVERQYRCGVDDFCYELPSGWIHEGEDPITTAKRECREETGWVLTNVRQLGVIYPLSGVLKAKSYIIRGETNKLTVRKPDLDEKDIETQFWSLEKIKKLIKNGTIRDMGFISAIAFL